MGSQPFMTKIKS